MVNLRKEKGSITVFVLVSGLFIIASVACTQMYMQSRQVAVEREYSQIKNNYESNETLDGVYERVKEKMFNFEAEVAKTDFKTLEGNLVLEITLNVKNNDGTYYNSEDTNYNISLDKEFLQISDNETSRTIEGGKINNDEVVLNIVHNPDKGTLEKDEINILVNSNTPYSKKITLPITDVADQYIDLLDGFNKMNESSVNNTEAESIENESENMIIE